MTRLRAVVLLVLAAALFILLRSGSLLDGPVICPLRSLTGIPCGSCGLTRATTALAQGRVREASAFHAAAVPFAMIGACALLALFAEVIAGRPVLMPLLRRYATALTWLAVALVVVGWAINLAVYFRDAPPALSP